MASSIDTQILNLLENLPIGTNQFTFLRAFFHSRVLPTSPDSFRAQLYIFVVVFILMLIALVVALLMTFIRKGAWILRLKKSRTGLSFVMVHASAWMITAIIFLTVLILFMVKNITSSKGILVLDIVEIESLVWISLVFSGWLAISSVAVSFIVQREQSGGSESSHPIIKFFLSPIFVNTFSILFPLIYVATVVPLALIAASFYKDTVRIYLEIDSQLALGEEFVAGGGAFSILQLQAGAPLEAQLLNAFNKFNYYFSQYFYATAGFVIVFVILLVTFVYLNLTHLRHAIANLERSSSGQAQFIAVKRTYTKMLITLGSILLLTFGEIISSINTAIATVGGETTADTRTLVALYLFTIPAIPIAITVLIRSFDRVTATPQSKSQSTATGTLTRKTYPRIEIPQYQKDFVHSHAAPLELNQVELRVFGGGEKSGDSLEEDEKFEGGNRGHGSQFHAV